MADDGNPPPAGSATEADVDDDSDTDAGVDSDPAAADLDADETAADGLDATDPHAVDSGPAGRERAESEPADREADQPQTADGEADPDVAAYTTDVRTISGRVRVQWAIRLFVGLAVLAVFGRLVLSALGDPLGPRVLLAGAGALGLLGLVWVHLRYRAWSYHLRDDALYLERGVLTRVKTVAPHVRIQHVDTSRSPVERALGLSTLVVYTAGSRGADVSIPGLTPGEADDLQRRLKELAIESGGGDAL